MTFELLRDFLDTLEREEYRQLSWGLCDGGFSGEEVRELATTFLSGRTDTEVDAPTLREELIVRGLLFEFYAAGRYVYRTRMAETTRLLVRLRQIFPGRRWEHAPTLVSDYRFSLRPRTYPHRHLRPDEVLRRVQETARFSLRSRQALEAMLSPGGKALELADFQLQATQRMLADLEQGRNKGMIVCAGTGTGKTLAFYLPALAHLASLVRANQYYTKALAVYPRTELLKDQLSETFLQARRLDGVLAPAGRKLLIAAFSGLTPNEASAFVLKKNKAWVERNGDFACPILRCPRCDGVLLWKKADLNAGKERLSCEEPGCSGRVEEDEIILTRNRLARTPPDILFTTTEMLNRQLSSSQFGHLFGLGAAARPRIVLLDEVHTYHGVHGAQVAHVLRRYRHALGGALHFTGLSATLRDAADFFSRLTGLPPSAVEEISPTGEMQKQGMEYQLALRGDPASGTSLLSTSIQAAMLLRRALDAPDGRSQGAYGKRVYCFTDDLDVTNRLFHDLRSAEGYNPWGRPERAPLAALRAPPTTDGLAQFLAGQYWSLCAELGHDLTQSLHVSRTSSQDVGVDRDSDVLVATASLEVGYNDPEVGAVMQHKAPRDVASFLQRRGRAGRRRTMRPWTVVVLSDYGRDRLAYQGYDHLFDPQLEGRTLPVLNRHVLRMQATYALMDWVATKLPVNASRGSVWNDFTRPAKDSGGSDRQRQDAELLERLLGEEGLRRELEVYLSKALQISSEEVTAVLWEPPRALMTSVVPTQLRRLRSKWTRVKVREGEGTEDLQARTAPLPDFVPENLFSDLNLPEVTIVTPPEFRSSEERLDAMPIVQAMRLLAPGNVTRRFSINRGDIKHWIPPPNLVDPSQDMPIESWCARSDGVGLFQVQQDGEVVPVRCIRPWELKAQVTERAILPSSRGSLEWRSQLFVEDAGVPIQPPQGTPWARLLQDVRYFTHNLDAHVHVRRFAIGSRVELKSQQEPKERRVTVRFCESAGGPLAAVGFSKEVDGIRFRVRLPEDLRMQQGVGSERKLRAFRSAWFRHRVQRDEVLSSLANTFQLDWLAQVFLAALVSHASLHGTTLQEAARELHEAQLDEELSGVLEVIFQVIEVEGSEETEPAGRARVHEAIEELCRGPQVRSRLLELARVLWEPPDAGWHAWAGERFCATLGGALLEACQRLCPQFDAGDLVLDIDSGPPPRGDTASPEYRELWITEDSLGGGGIVEEILRRTAEDPRLFYLLVESALAPSDFELVDTELTRLLGLLRTDTELAEALAGVRDAYGMGSLSRAAEHLRSRMASRGLLTSHSVICALNARVLRPNSGPETDEFLRELLRLWEQEEARLGLEIDARPFAFVASQSESLASGLARVGQGMQEEAVWRFRAIYGLLWPRGSVVRARALSSYNPFTQLPEADRELVLDCIGPTERVFELSQPDWREQVRAALSEGATVKLTAAGEARDELKAALLQLVSEPIEAGFLHLFPRVEAVVHDLAGFSAKLRCPEAIP